MKIDDLQVGDTVYQTDGVRVYPSVIQSIYPGPGGRTIFDTDGVAFDHRAVGTSIFLTAPEAEAAKEAMR